MTIFEHLYSDKTTLIDFFQSIKVASSSNVLIQILSSKKDYPLSSLMGLSNEFFDAEVIGIETEIIVFNGQALRNQIAFLVTVLSDVKCSIIHQGHDEFNEFPIPKELYNQPNLNSLIQLVSSLPYTQTKIILDTIENVLPSTEVTGGIIHDASIHYNGRSYKQGYIGIVYYGPSLSYQSFNTSSIIPIGREHVITKAKGNQILEIDDITSKEFYESYLGSTIWDDINYFGFKFPFVIEKDGATLPSPVTLCSESNCILSKISINVGDRITLGYGDVNHYIDEYKVFMKYLPKIPCEQLLAFTSKPRTLDLLEHMKGSSFNLPVFGLLTDYEIATDNNHLQLTSETTSITAVSGSKASYIRPETTELKLKENHQETEHSVLLKLVENTSQELNTLNRTLERLVMDKTNELLEQYYTDNLTHLPNLNKLSEDLNEADDIYHLCLIDISAFININNFYGASIGNKVLKELADLITNNNSIHQLRTYRVHSDIFAVTSHESSFRLFTNRMRQLQTKIHHHCFVSRNQKIYINTTFAMSNMKLALYENTSMTLQHAKAEKMTFLIYNEQLKIEDSIISNLTWSSKIRHAIDDDRIVPFFQPLYNNETDRIDRFEVLMRLIEEDGTVVSPFQFLSIAKKAGLYDQLTTTIIAKSFDYFEDKPYKFSINISPEDIANPQTRSFIYNQLATFSQPENVIFEIVETESIENFDAVARFINETKRYGAQIAIDDFGTGFSNFHYLFKLNVDCIKIDGSIIQQLNNDSSAELVAETIVDFASKMGIYTVAEFVSDEELFNKTKSMGIDFAQGYFVARPACDIVM